MLRAATVLTSLELHKTQPIATHIEAHKEAWGILLRSAQSHYPLGMKEMAEKEIHGIKATNMRLASHTAGSLYGTK